LIAPIGITPNGDGTITIPNQGTYSLNNGVVSFTPIPGFTGDPTPIKYTITELITGLVSNEATITPNYAATAPTVVADANGTPTDSGLTTVINLLTNDTLGDGTTPKPEDVTITLIPPMGITANMDGSITISGQGTYTLNPATGEVTFDPIAGYIGDPTPITYTITDKDNGATSSPAMISLDYTNLPLPVSLISFKGKLFESQINLVWQVADEKEFSHFEVQKSKDAMEFGTIDKVNGTKANFYNTIDANPIEGLNYYRLKMVDLDGSNKFSNIISINFEKEASFAIVENPANNGEFKVFTNLKKPRFTLNTTLGSNIEINIVQINKGYSIKPQNVPAGIYYLNIYSAGKAVIKKILIP
jgi:CshA-type fibril repeat protein